MATSLTSVKNTAPRGTNQHPWTRAQPYSPNAPFAAATAGCLINTTAAASAKTLYQRLIAAELRANDQNAAGELMPLQPAASLVAEATTWVEKLDAADLTLIRPYLVLFNATPPTANAATPSAGAVTGRLQFWLARAATAPNVGRPIEYNATYAGEITLVNNGAAIAATSKAIPTAAQGCVITVAVDALPSPGITVTGAGGAEHIRFDHEGALYLITRASGLTANAGVGWERSHV